jgi:hypothetical protein
MMNTATLTCYHNSISWIVKVDGQMFTGGDPARIGNSYMVTLSNVVNRLQDLHGILDFDFIRG